MHMNTFKRTSHCTHIRKPWHYALCVGHCLKCIHVFQMCTVMHAHEYISKSTSIRNHERHKSVPNSARTHAKFLIHQKMFTKKFTYISQNLYTYQKHSPKILYTYHPFTNILTLQRCVVTENRRGSG